MLANLKAISPQFWRFKPTCWLHVLTSQIKGPQAFKKKAQKKKDKANLAGTAPLLVEHICLSSRRIGFGLGQTQMIGLVGVTKLI